ncbi:Yip1 family protein [Pseudalkalibacillus berkeleyi]|uniref:YIP1 family protein n=1 Tax=Pseudalkalibacillus berkeleyi TaxID=1069813 RepID=A0ABS9H4Y8_9BACL|nr:Yip1 family protein [Pseudalkalibacillus berkeleyi]MCF6139156.1 YIP1 family protein [Pseudalkalibacillus berkeleyi]
MDNTIFNKALLTIWTSPRKTIRTILDSGDDKYTLILVSIAGIMNALNRASGSNMGEDMSIWAIILLALFFGPLSGIISLYIGTLLISWTGKWIGGVGDHSEIKVAYAWSNVPAIISVILWIPQLIFFGDDMFTANMEKVESNLGFTILFFAISAIEAVLLVWGIIILIKSIAEAQQFSSWRAIGNLLLSVLIVVVPILLIVLIANG